MNAQQLPRTDSIHELAKFWDTHDLTDFEGELEEVGEQVFDLGTEITVHLQADEAEALRKIAKSKGLADTDLIRAWVLEKIHTS